VSMTGLALRQEFLRVVSDQFGYTSGEFLESKFGKRRLWASRWVVEQDWQGFWCNRFLSWGIDQVMGAQPGQAAVGRQPGTPLPVGFAATWLQREWFMAHGVEVPYRDAEPGDFFLFKMKGRRKKNPTNHIGVCTRRVPGKHVVLEGNLPQPGGPKETIGVWAHDRPQVGAYGRVVGVFRPRWSVAAKAYNKVHPEPVAAKPVAPPTDFQKSQLRLLGFAPTTAGVKKFQKGNGLMGLGMVGPLTQQLLADKVAEHRRKEAARPKPKAKPTAKKTAASKASTVSTLISAPSQADARREALDRHRVAGPTRFTTAVAVSRDAFPDGAVTVYLVGESGLDAALAVAYRDGPVLLVPHGDTPDPAVLAEITRLRPRAIKAIGGRRAVSDAQLSAALAAGGVG
jgi:hypothetical protein